MNLLKQSPVLIRIIMNYFRPSPAQIKAANLSQDGKANPLIVAIIEGNRDNVRVLIKQHVHENIILNDGRNVLQFAIARAPHDNQFIVDMIIRACPMRKLFENRDDKLQTALIIQAIMNGDVTYLLQKGAEVNVMDNKGFTPLHLAILHENVRNCEVILGYDPDIHCKGMHHGDLSVMELAIKLRHGNKAAECIFNECIRYGLIDMKDVYDIEASLHGTRENDMEVG